MSQPFYNPNLSYQENYDLGPFGGFPEEPSGEDRDALERAGGLAQVGGLRLRRGIGIPAGPLLNSRYTEAAFKWGYDLCHYKTVRSRAWPSHPTPNVLHVRSPEPVPPDRLGREPLVARPFAPGEDVDVETLSITNSFGMPAQPPEVWQADMERAARGAGPGQALIASVYGTQDESGGSSAYVADFARAAGMAAETGAHAIEVNLSCPNLGGHGLLCHDSEAARLVCEAAWRAVGSLPLFVKLSAFPPNEAGDALLAGVIEATAPYAQGYGVVNAVPVPIVASDGVAALPGAGRAMAGVCGAALKATGLNMVRRLSRLRERRGYDFAIIGVGGLASPADFLAYLEAGADAIQGATGPMWNHRLAVEVASSLKPEVYGPPVT
jgi:dihydroorotate dehydrogenase (NAD+) catalytic subunit